MTLDDILNNVPDEEERFLLHEMCWSQVVTSKTEQAQTLLQIRMTKRLIESLDKNSKSSGKLACTLNWLTGVIAFATVAGAVFAFLQLFK